MSDGVCVMILFKIEYKKLREQDLNLRPSGYEPDDASRLLHPALSIILYAYAVDLSNSTGRMEVTVLHFEKNRNKVMSWKGVMYESD